MRYANIDYGVVDPQAAPIDWREVENYAGRFEDAEAARAGILAGNAEVTLVGQASRFTYQIRKHRRDDIWFVSLLTGSDNTADYTYCGFIRDGEFITKGKVRISADAPGVVAFRWAWSHLDSDQMEIWHSDKCCRCGRLLTVPESIGRGLGPVCAGRA